MCDIKNVKYDHIYINNMFKKGEENALEFKQ